VAAEARARGMADAIPQLIGVTAPDGALLSVNRTYTAYTGLTIDQARDAAWTVTIHPDDVEAMVRDWQAAVGRAEPYETQYRLRRHDGVYRWFLNRAIPIRDGSGEVTAWVGTATDIDERKRAEDALRVVVEADAVFAGTLETATALQQLAGLAVRHLADWCGVYVYDAEGRLRPLAIAHADPSRVRFVREYLRRYPIRPQDGLAVVAASGVPERINGITRDMFEAMPDREQRALALSLGVRAVMNVPLAVGETRFGALSLALSESDRAFTDDDQRLAMLIAQRASIALSNAQLYERQREVARTLQASFLPADLPRVDGVAFDAVYAPGTRDLTVGGDWYDAFAYDGTALGFSVGDVAGRGLAAAVTMGKMRQTFRALADVERDPARVLAVADAVLRREHPDVFVTAFGALYEPATGVLRYANAGHPAPCVRAADGTLRRLAAAGVPLGLGDLGAPLARADALAPGDLLVAFTDGLIETTHDIAEGERRVAEALAHPAFALCSRPAALLRTLVVPDVPADDVAILTARIGAGADWTFDANDGGLAQAAREAFVARLAAAGIGRDEQLAAEVVFGEIVGNAARYTPGPVDLALRRSGSRLVLAVLDRGPGFRWRAVRPADDSENGRGLFLVERLARAVHAEHLAGFGTYLEVTLAV
ncbi:MAG: hypothetical protein QOI11_2108, partial [Candidatus Eremiobacteraeota bacterium]|nr:hypothetical protein [Candidatus Eremiobacteraeota bacterium]